MEDYKPNSHRSKSENNVSNNNKEEKKITPVANGKVRKKSTLSKAAGNIISEDVHNVKTYIIMDVLIPAAKKAISDIVSNGIEMLLYGETRKERRGNSTYVSYNKYSSDRYADRRDDRYNRRSVYVHDDVWLSSRREAEDVISGMQDIIDTYDQVSVADMYDLANMPSQYTDNNFGWTNIRNARPVRVNDGYILEMPKAIPLN